MDILLHAAGLAFLPLMAYMVIDGIGDIWAALRKYYGDQKKGTPGLKPAFGGNSPSPDPALAVVAPATGGL